MSKSKYWLIFIIATSMLTLFACESHTDTPDAIAEDIETKEVAIESTAVSASGSSASSATMSPLLPTLTNTKPQAPTEEQLTFNPAAIVWKATHETGDISEWQQHGDFIRQGQSAYYSMATPFSHTGKYSVSLTIDTEGYSDSGGHAAYLFFWDQLPEDAYYYSAWYYIPAGTEPQHWWNIWQWKSTYNGNTDYSVPMYSLDVQEQIKGQMELKLVYRPDLERNAISYQQNIKTLPHDRWVHIEAYYKKAVDDSGQVIVWQDGEEIFNLTDVKTTEQDNTVYWSINHYTDEILPAPSSIYIDDAAISTERIGPNYTLPQ